MPEDILDNEVPLSGQQPAQSAHSNVMQSREEESDESGGEDMADTGSGSGAGGGGR